MTVYGGSLSYVRSTLVSRLSARPGLGGVQVNYTPPVQTPQVMASNGVGEAVWVDNAVDGVSRLLRLGTPLKWEEHYQLKVVAEVLPLTTSFSPSIVDDRAAEIAGEVLDEIASNPRYNFSNWAVWIEPEGFRTHIGHFDADLWAAAYEVHLTVKASNA